MAGAVRAAEVPSAGPVIQGPQKVAADSGLVTLSVILPDQGSAIWRIDYPPGIKTATSDDGTRFYFGSTCSLDGKSIYISCVIVNWQTQTITQDIHEIRIGLPLPSPDDPDKPDPPVDPVFKFGFDKMIPLLDDSQALVEQLPYMAHTFRATCDWAGSEILRRAGRSMSPLSTHDVLNHLADLQRSDTRLIRSDWKEVFAEMTRIHEQRRNEGKIKTGADYAAAYCEIADVMELVLGRKLINE